MPAPAPTLFQNGYTNNDFPALLPFTEGGLGSPYQGAISFEPFGPNVKISFGPNSRFESIEELFDDINGTPFNSGGPRTYVRRFRVLVKKTYDDNPAVRQHRTANLAGPVAICQCPGVPVPYAPYIPYRQEEWDLKALAVNISAARELKDDHQSWIVTVTYSTEMPPGGPTYGQTVMPWHAAGNQSNPWQLPVVKEYETESYTEYPLHDLDGRPFLDSAGRPFNPTIPVVRGDRVLSLTRNERATTYESPARPAYEYSSNTVSILGSPPGYAYCLGSRAQQCWLGSTEFFRVTYKIVLRKKKTAADGTVTPAFNPQKVLNAGMYQRAFLFGVVPGVPKIIPIIKFGMPVSGPVLLDENGFEQTNMRDIQDPVTGENYNEPSPTYRYFKVMEQTDLTQLLLPGG